MVTIIYKSKMETNRKQYSKQLEDYISLWLYTSDYTIHQPYFKPLWMMFFTHKNRKEDYLFI